MNTIDIITIVITRERLTIQACGEEIIKEEYFRQPDGTMDCIAGNFEDEQGMADRDQLVNLLCGLAMQSSPLLEIQEELNK